MTSIDYARIVAEASAASPAHLIEVLRAELPYVWLDAYVATTTTPTNVLRFQHGTFEYIYDHYAELEARGAVPHHPTAESRLVAVCGLSAPKIARRDDYRLRGWVGRTERTFGREWDKGHFIAHSIGGAVDGLEANVFLQRRDVNRGWSDAGKRFRAMEKYCCEHAGTFCFSRPLYTDETARPSEVEFGVLRSASDFWVERYPNQY